MTFVYFYLESKSEVSSLYDIVESVGRTCHVASIFDQSPSHDLTDAACTSVTLTMATLLTTTSRRVITVYLSVLMGFACGDTVSRIRGENSALYRGRGECKRDARGSIYSLISRKDEFDEWARSLRSSTRVSIYREETVIKLNDTVKRSSLVQRFMVIYDYRIWKIFSKKNVIKSCEQKLLERKAE